MSNIFLRSFGRRGEEQFNFPVGVTCDHDGNIVVSDSGKHCIKIFKLETSKMSPIGLQGKLKCEPTAHIDLQSKFKLLTSSMSPIGLQSKFSNKGEFLFCFGSEGRGEGQFDKPRGVTCDQNGNIVVCDSWNHRIQVFSKEGKFLFSFGSKGTEEGQLNSPRGVTCDHDGNVVVCDTWNHRIQVFKCEPSAHIGLQSKLTNKGDFLYSFGNEGGEEGEFGFPVGITCDHDGNIIVCDSGNHRIQIFTNKGKFIRAFGSKGKGEGQFDYPSGVTCDHDGNIVVCDSNNNRIQTFTNKGNFIRSFGKEGQFLWPEGVTCDHDGNIIVVDTWNQRIQVFKGPSEVPTLLSLCWEKIEKECI
jgi:tripartite motif-containing protein 71